MAKRSGMTSRNGGSASGAPLRAEIVADVERQLVAPGLERRAFEQRLVHAAVGVGVAIGQHGGFALTPQHDAHAGGGLPMEVSRTWVVRRPMARS